MDTFIDNCCAGRSFFRFDFTQSDAQKTTVNTKGNVMTTKVKLCLFATLSAVVAATLMAAGENSCLTATEMTT